MNTVGELLDHRARRDPDGTVATDLDGRRYSAAQFQAQARDVATALDAMPAPAGIVVVALPNQIETAVACLAVLRSRHALIMVHPDLSPRIRRAVQHDLRPLAEIVHDPASTPPLRIVHNAQRGAGSPLWTPPRAAPDLAVALCVLTSGSTGRSRVIAAPHRQVRTAVDLIGEQLGYRRGDVVAVVPPLSFDYGLYQLLLSLAGGATVLLDPRLHTVLGLTHAIAHRGANVVPVVPSMLRAFLAAPTTGRVDLSRVRLVTTTGDLLTEADAAAAKARFPNADIVPMYGLSECKRVAITPVGSHRPTGAVGLPLRSGDLAVGTPTATRLGAGTAGELTVSGPHLTLGYLGDEAATARRFAVDPRSGIPILRTGDRLCQDPAGWLYWIGRGSEVIKTSGFRVDPAEIEGVAATSLEVLESAAYGRRDDMRGQVPMLAVRFRDGADPVAARRLLLDTLRQNLPRWAVPDVEVRVDPLPRTHNQKIDRAALGGQPGRSADDDGPTERLPPLALTGVRLSRQFINCHTQAFLSAYPLPYRMTPAEFEVLTTVPFGTRADPDDPHRLLVPFLDPDVGLDRAVALLGLQMETVWSAATDAVAALRRLCDWLRTGPVVLGPLDLGRLPYLELAQTLHGCDHYLVVLGQSGPETFVVRDPEGFVQVELARDALVAAWAADSVPEGRGAFTQRRLILTDVAAGPPADLPSRLAALALDNLCDAAAHPTGGEAAYRALARLPGDATQRRSLSLLLPAAASRYRLSAAVADTVLSRRCPSAARNGWRQLARLFDAQMTTLSQLHRAVCVGEATDGLFDTVSAGEREIACRARETRKAVDR